MIISPYLLPPPSDGGQFFVADQFKRHIMPHIDGYLGRRSRLVGYQYSEILPAMMSNYGCHFGIY